MPRVEDVMAANPELVEAASFGREVEHFLNGRIGNHLIQRAKAQSDQWTEKLKNIDPWETDQVMLCQMKIHVAELIIGWLGEVIAEGHQALQALEEQ
jgi:hypothetical protein